MGTRLLQIHSKGKNDARFGVLTKCDMRCILALFRECEFIPAGDGSPRSVTPETQSMCWEYLKRDGLLAKIAVEAGACTEAVETVVEVNTYLSSVGFESGGLAAAHAIKKGFTFIPQLHDLYHGNKVAFCTLVQLVMEDAPQAELEEVLDFCCDVGLPVCFADMVYQAMLAADALGKRHHCAR